MDLQKAPAAGSPVPEAPAEGGREESKGDLPIKPSLLRVLSQVSLRVLDLRRRVGGEQA